MPTRNKRARATPPPSPRRWSRLQKCPKLSQSHGVEEEQRISESDPFSRLTDDIIVSHILSRLSVRDAVRTSVLSRRWLPLWPASIGPNLIFPFSSYGGRCSLVEEFTPLLTRGVNNVLNAYSKPTLDELAICFDFNSTSSQFIDNWVQFAFTKGVSRLHLDFLSFLSYEKYTFPGIDKLSALHALCNNDLHLPVNCTGMYNLRDVSLKCVNVPSEVVELMLSNCPFIERVSVWRSECLGHLRVFTQSSKFESLEIVDCFYSQIKISAPYLVSLRFSGSRDELCLEYVPLLSELSIGRGYCRLFLKNRSLHFGYISQLKKLTLDLELEVVIESIIYPLEFSELVKLEQLEVKLRTKKDSCLLWLIILIKAAPFLRYFSIEFIDHTRNSYRKGILSVDNQILVDEHQTNLRNLRNAIKQVRHQFLKLIEIKGFRGELSQMEFGQHLLGISGSLEQFVVQPLNRIRLGRVKLQSVQKYRQRAEEFSNWLDPAVKFVIH